MTTETIALSAGLIFIFVAIIGGGITAKDTHIPIIHRSGRVALGFIGLLLCLPFIVGKLQGIGSGVPKGTIVAWSAEFRSGTLWLGDLRWRRNA
jgi:hypothetical protein